jgi:hypothetical protein
VPVRRDGRLSDIGVYKSAVQPERCFVHESVATPRRLEEVFADTSPLWDGFDDREVHPLLFVAKADLERGQTKALLDVPVFQSPALRRVTVACWGHLADADRDYWDERFEVSFLEEEDAAAHALMAGQVGIRTSSPLRLSTRFMDVVEWNRPQEWPYLIGLRSASFNELVGFWNFRSRSYQFRPGSAVVGLPYQLLRHASALTPVREWLAPRPGERFTPDVFINCPGGDLPEYERTLKAAGLQRESSPDVRRSWGRDIRPNESPTYAPGNLFIGGRLSRGTSDSALVPKTRRMSLALDPPGEFDLRTGHSVRLSLRNLPLPLPITASMARRIHPDGIASDGVMIAFAASRRYSFDITFPQADEALADWCTDHGLQGRATQDSRYANALISRLATPDALDALATEDALRVLSELAPESRKKLAQRLRREFEEAGIKLNEEELAERLKGGEIALDLDDASAQALADKSGLTRRVVFDVLDPLVAAGFVTRGQRVRCPPATVRTSSVSMSWQSESNAASAAQGSCCQCEMQAAIASHLSRTDWMGSWHA